MEEVYKPRNILYLRDIVINDVDDDEFEKLALQKFTERKTTASTFLQSQDSTFHKCEPLPKIFTDLLMWPTETRIRCWNCDLSFTSKPISLPYKVQKNSENKFEFSMKGCFCTFACMQRYLNNLNISKHTKEKYQSYIDTLFFLFHGVNVSIINESLPKFDMQSYGGSLSVTDYRNSTQEKEKETYDLAIKKMGNPIPIADRCGIIVENIYSRKITEKDQKCQSLWCQFGKYNV